MELLTLNQIAAKEKVKTSDERWSELTTPPNTTIGFGATALGAVWLSGAVPGNRALGAVAGAVLGNFVFNALYDDAKQTGTEIIESLKHPLTQQTKSTGSVISKIEGGGANVDSVDLANTAVGAMDGVSMVESVAHRYDPTWHPYGDNTIITAEQIKNTSPVVLHELEQETGRTFNPGDSLFIHPQVGSNKDKFHRKYRKHWYQWWLPRNPHDI